jgi:Transposase DDE domain
MERELWPPLYRLIEEIARDIHQKYVRHQPGVIVAVLVWAALHDRTVSWACDPRHWDTAAVRPPWLPSASTVSRRVDGVAVGVFLRMLGERVRGRVRAAVVAVIDGKPLPVGGNSKDPDARFGRGAGGIAKGYKLHAIWAEGPLPEAWEVTAMNGCEKAAARRLLGEPAVRGAGYVLGDGNYDASPVYDAAAAAGRQLLAPCRKAATPGCGKHYQSPHRLAGLAMLRTARGRRLYRRRTGIERRFAHLTGFAGGLAPLPSWVRGSARVRSWVWAKLIINGVRIRRTGQ